MAIERYPLAISVPTAETARQWLDRHSMFVIEVDDCGKIYTCQRRYTNFSWLHTELRSRNLGCALPELPPKRAVGRMEETFVEGRRRSLEDYLRALLRLPAVIQDDSLWTFLDADIATAVVPRFLCRPQAPSTAGELLRQLERVASVSSSTFRFCSPAVLDELVVFIRAEAAEGAAPAAGPPSPAHQRELQARLNNRLRLCSVLQILMRHERARQGLVDAGAFSALLALLQRANEDAVAQPAAGSPPPAPGRPSSGGPTAQAPRAATAAQAADTRRAATTVLADCLRGFLDSTRGEAMLRFCQQDGGFSALQPLAAPEAPALHPVCASLLWHGFQHPGVVQAFSCNATCGLKLLGRLLRSPDLCARLLAGLCLGCVLRCEGALDEDSSNFCLEAFPGVIESLDMAEEEALERAAATGVRPAPADGGARQVQVDYDPAIVSLLRTLCSEKELPRVRGLLTGPSEAEVCPDSVAALCVAVLGHFVRQCQHQPERLSALSPLAPLLQQLVDGDEDRPRSDESWQQAEDSPRGGWTVEGPRGSSDVAVRASRVLLHLDWPAARTMGPDALVAFAQRFRMFGTLSHHSEECRYRASGRLVSSNLQNQQQEEDVRARGLMDQLSMGQQSLADFGARLSQLEQRRAGLGGALGSLREARNSVGVSMDRHGVKHTILGTEVQEFQRRLESNGELETRRGEAVRKMSDCEDGANAALGQLEALSAQAREAEAVARERVTRQRSEEDRAAELARRASDLAEICHNAPAQLERLRTRLEEAAQRKSGLVELGLQLGSEADRKDRAAVSLRESEKEAMSALKNLALVKAELQEFRGTLQSELILSEREVERLQHLELRLLPARPSRLRRASEDWEGANAVAAQGSTGSCEAPPQAGSPEGPGGSPAMPPEAEAAGAGAPPNWDGAHADQEFRAEPQFRKFSQLCAEREHLWEEERRWLQELAKASEAEAARLSRQRRETEEGEIAKLEEEEQQLRRDIAELSDLEGHGLRHQEAVAAASEAHKASQAAAIEATEATGAHNLVDTRLERAKEQASRADEVLAGARDASSREMELHSRACAELQAQCQGLERSFRSCIEEWRAVEVEERQTSLLQRQVESRIREEGDERTALRAEVGRLTEVLRALDEQLQAGELAGRDCPQ